MSELVIKVTIDTSVLDALVASVPGGVENALLNIGADIEADAKQFAPVDTGALRNSIHSGKAGALLVRIEDGVEYGIYQELGTRKMRAQPFMIPAVVMHTSDNDLVNYIRPIFNV